MMNDGGKQTRNRKNGRYGFDGQWDRLCVCGQPLGAHTAEAPHTIDDDLGNLTMAIGTGHHECRRFRPAKKVAE